LVKTLTQNYLPVGTAVVLSSATEEGSDSGMTGGWYSVGSSCIRARTATCRRAGFSSNVTASSSNLSRMDSVRDSANHEALIRDALQDVHTKKELLFQKKKQTPTTQM
jgi:hypothetical protein